jgi:hypothetical protein
MDIKIELLNEKQIIETLGRAAEQIPHLVRKKVEEWAWGQAVPACQEAAPVGLGHTRDSIVAEVEGRGVDAEAHIIADTPQAVFTEFGTRPHPIDPVNRKALCWQTPRGMVTVGPKRTNKQGETVWSSFNGSSWSSGKRTHAVNHPGTAARPWFFNTIDSELPKLSESLTKSILRSLAARGATANGD